MLCIFGNADVNCWDAIMLALILGTSHPNDDFENRVEGCDIESHKMFDPILS